MNHAAQELRKFVQRLIALRKRHRIFRRQRFFSGRIQEGAAVADIHWLTPQGTELADEAWHHGLSRCFGALLVGAGMREFDERRRPITDDNFLLLLNAHNEPIPFVLPAAPGADGWWLLIDTAQEGGMVIDPHYYSSEFGSYALQARSLVLFTDAKPTQLVGGEVIASAGQAG